MLDIYKKFHLVNLETLLYLSRYFFLKKCNDILERSSENIYAIENRDCERNI
jgi:hypothetical protein